LKTRKVPVPVYAVAFLLAISALFPMYWMIATSLRKTSSLYAAGAFVLEQPILDNYVKLVTMRDGIYFRWYWNTLLVALSVTAAVLVVSALGGYTFSKLVFPGREAIFTTILATLMIPYIVSVIPLFLMFRGLNLIDTYAGLIFPGIVSVGAVPMFWMRQYISTLPKELESAAMVDGCSELGVFTRIVFPLCKPALAVAGIYTFWQQWISFFWPLIITQSDEMKVLTVGITTFYAQYTIDWGLVMAGTTLTTIPLLIFFLFFQRYFITGLTMGALKA